MHQEFGFDEIQSVEFCVSVEEGDEHENYLVPTDQSVQEALRAMLTATVDQLENPGETALADAAWQPFELSEKYATKERLVAALATEEMSTIHDLYREEGWSSNPHALQNPRDIAYYFAVFRDVVHRKLLGVRRATQFKGVLKSRLIRLIDDSLTMVGDNIFRLDNEFDFLITEGHAYILHPVGFERIAEIEELVSERARAKTRALEQRLSFVDFTSLAEFVAHHKRAARLVVALSSRMGLEQIEKSLFTAAARETDVMVVAVGSKISPAAGSEIAFLELIDDRRYTTAIRAGPKEAYIASSRRPLRPPATS